MLLASPALKDYFSKLVDAKVDVLSSINQRLGENKGKEAARSTFSPQVRKLYSFEVHSLIVEVQPITETWIHLASMQRGAKVY
jgi:hypothetical protein